jgi:hypothetical protein
VYAVHEGSGLLYVAGGIYMLDHVARSGLAVFNGLTSLGNAIASSDPCPGAALTITFATTGSFAPANVFTAEMSGPDGSFDEPVILGSVTGGNGGTIIGLIPNDSPPGSGYHIRLRSSEPPMISGIGTSLTMQEPLVWYADIDQDGFGDPSTSINACDQPQGMIDNALDCSDTDAMIYIGAPCDDGLPGTSNDTWQEDCTCSGQLTTSLEEMVEYTGVHSWPNPVYDELHFHRCITAMIVDVNGRSVAEVINDDVINTANFPQGKYLIRTSVGEVWRFIKL